MAKTIGRFTPSKVPAAPSSFKEWIVGQTGFNDRLGLIPASISPSTVDAIRKEAEGGSLGRLYELYEKTVATDSRIGGIVGSLKATVSGLPLKVLRGRTASAGEVALAEDYRNVVIEALANIDTQTYVSDLVDAYLYGTKAFQVKWELVEYGRGKMLWLPATPHPIPGQSLAQEMTMLHPKYGELFVKTYEDPNGVFFSDIDLRRAFIITDGSAKARHDVIGALRRVLGWWITKMYAQLWWVEFVESYGQPMRLAKYGPESGAKERGELKSFLQNIGRNKWGLFPAGVDLQLVESSNSGAISTFSDLINMANHEIAVALVGQTGITQDSAQGSRAKLQVLDGVRIEIVNHIAGLVAKGFDALIEATIRVNYGDNYNKRLLPKINPLVKKPGSDSEKATVFKTLSELGIAVPVDEIHDQIGIPQAEEGQLVLFKGRVKEMTDYETMNEEQEEYAQQSFGNEGGGGDADQFDPSGSDSEGSADGESGTGETDQGSDAERGS